MSLEAQLLFETIISSLLNKKESNSEESTPKNKGDDNSDDNSDDKEKNSDDNKEKNSGDDKEKNSDSVKKDESKTNISDMLCTIDFKGVLNSLSKVFEELPEKMKLRKEAHEYGMELINKEGKDLTIKRTEEINDEVREKYGHVLDLKFKIDVKYM